MRRLELDGSLEVYWRATAFSRCVWVILQCAMLLACASAQNAQVVCDDKSFEIRQREASYGDVDKLKRDYREEHEYIAARRQQQSGQQGGALDDLVGLSLSGGGIRAATLGLGVLQGLGESDQLARIDYMSAVSGGGYIASWMQAHFGANQNGHFVDSQYVEVGTESAAALVDPHRDHVEHLRTHSGFLRRGGFWEAPALIGSYLWRWPCAFVLDIALHLKRPFNNFCHPIAIYRDRLERTYLRAREDLLFSDVNHDPERTTPYLILNGNLTNWGQPRSGASEPKQRSLLEPYNFEFTRDFTGSDGIGYVRSEAFGRPVDEVIESNGVPQCVRVENRSSSYEHLPQMPERSPDRLARINPDPGELSSSVAASGAAFDPDGVILSIGRTRIRGALAFVTAPFNLNVGLEAPNFARKYDGAFGTPYDYLRMVTWQRLPPLVTTDARWIKVTDGGHYDNLGVAALARRGVKCIVALDATADGKFEYRDLGVLGDRLDSLGLRLEPDSPSGAPLPPVDRVTRARFKIVRQGDAAEVATVLYLKSNADDGQAHMSDGDNVEVRKLRAFREWTAEASGKPSFPHRTTFVQWYQWEEFEAYRMLGHRMAETYLADADFETCEFSRK